MKIGFVLDTNILKKSPNDLFLQDKYLDNLNFFLEYIEDFKKINTEDELLLFVPKLVLEELYYQKLDAFNKSYKDLQEKYNNILYGLKGDCPTNNIEVILKREKEKYKKNSNIIFLDTPYEKTVFKELVNDALQKKPPFDKSYEGKKTDSGFKDALIWKTVVYNKKIDNCDLIYFFSGDKNFIDDKESMEKEFYKKHAKVKLIIRLMIPDGSQRQNCLNTIIDENNLIKTNIIKLYNKEIILKFLKNINYKEDEEIFYDVDKTSKLINIFFEDFSTNDYYIEDVSEDGESYNILIKLKTDKYELSDISAIKGPYIKPLKGLVKLRVKGKRDYFTLQKYELSELQLITEMEKSVQALVKASSFDIPNINYLSEILKPVVDELRKEYNPLINIMNNTKFQDNIQSLFNAIKPIHEVIINNKELLNKSINNIKISDNNVSVEDKKGSKK